jgi:ParB family chromosome partitioning protein
MINRRPKGLGRGLEALLGGDTVDEPVPLAGTPTTLPLAVLQTGRYQPRTRMDEGALNELAESIKSQGLMQPILVRPVNGSVGGTASAPGRYEIIAGERRFRAAAIAGLIEVPVLVKDVPDESAAVMALIENIQREDLNPLEEAQGVQRLLTEFNLTHEQAAQAIGRSRSATSNMLRLLNLAKPVQVMLMAGDLDMGHARALLAVDSATQIALATQVVAKRLSVREAEHLVSRVAATMHSDFSLVASKKPANKSRDVVRLEEELSDVLATKVTIKVGARQRGRLQIDFDNLDALDGIIARLNPQ